MAAAVEGMTRRVRQLFAAAFCIGLVSVASGCSHAPANAPMRVRLAVGGQNQMIYLPTTLADALGYYREEGLEVELQDFPGGAKALQALVGGSADVVSGF
jgi:NitT/TauT family transport system substrate-binding protein